MVLYDRPTCASFQFAREAPPTPKTEKPKKEGWWSWLTGGTSESEDEEEPALQPGKYPEFWNKKIPPFISHVAFRIRV